MQSPEIITRRLRLVAPAPEFAANVFEYSRDEEFCRHIDARPAASVTESRDFLDQLTRDNAAGRRCYWVVVDRSTDRAIGTLGLIFFSDKSDFPCQVGYGIARTHWGTGVFQEGLRAAIDHGFTALGCERIFIVTRYKNDRSVKAVKKLGFRQIKILERFYENEPRDDAVVLCLTDEDANQWGSAPLVSRPLD